MSCLHPALCRLLILVYPLCSDRYKIDNIVNAPEVSKIGFQIGRIQGFTAFRPSRRLGIENIVSDTPRFHPRLPSRIGRHPPSPVREGVRGDTSEPNLRICPFTTLARELGNFASTRNSPSPNIPQEPSGLNSFQPQGHSPGKRPVSFQLSVAGPESEAFVVPFRPMFS